MELFGNWFDTYLTDSKVGRGSTRSALLLTANLAVGAALPQTPCKSREAKYMERQNQRRQTERLQVRVTPATKERLLAICRATGKSQSELIRQWADSRKVVSKSDSMALAELRRQGGLLKTMLVELRENGGLTDRLHEQLEETLGVIGHSTEQIILGGARDSTPD